MERDSRSLPVVSLTLAVIANLPERFRRTLKRLPGSRKVQARLSGSPSRPTPQPGHEATERYTGGVSTVPSLRFVSAPNALRYVHISPKSVMFGYFDSAIEAAANDKGTEEFEARARAAADDASWDSRVEIVRHQVLEQEQLSVPS